MLVKVRHGHVGRRIDLDVRDELRQEQHQHQGHRRDGDCARVIPHGLGKQIKVRKGMPTDATLISRKKHYIPGDEHDSYSVK